MYREGLSENVRRVWKSCAELVGERGVGLRERGYRPVVRYPTVAPRQRNQLSNRAAIDGDDDSLASLDPSQHDAGPVSQLAYGDLIHPDDRSTWPTPGKHRDRARRGLDDWMAESVRLRRVLRGLPATFDIGGLPTPEAMAAVDPRGSER